jgi:type IV secretory pathway TraG/TraD family ATPase VirD4
MARPKKVINQKQFESLCAIQCTQEEICNVLDVTDKTLTRWCNEVYDLSFSEVYEQKRDIGRMSLRRNQFKLAEGGNTTMQIWLGKQVLKQSENPVMDNIKLKELELKIKEFELKEKLMLRQLEEGNNHSDVAQALREVFGNENNK